MEVDLFADTFFFFCGKPNTDTAKPKPKPSPNPYQSQRPPGVVFVDLDRDTVHLGVEEEAAFAAIAMGERNGW